MASMDPSQLPYASLYELIGVGEFRDPPTEYRIFLAGENATDKGTFLFDEEAQRLVMEAWAKRGVDMAMDYEHQSLQDPPIEAPNAATRIVPQVRNGELWATEVKWTDRAAGYLRAGEYRYTSPAFNYDGKTFRITNLINVALTNNPATYAIAPLVAASTQAKEPRMDFEKVIAELKAKLAEQETQIAALTAAKTEAEQRLAALTATKEGTEGEVEQLSAALSISGKTRPERVAAATSLATLRSNLMTLTGAQSEAQAIGTVAGWKQNAQDVAKLTARVEEMETEKLNVELEGLLNEAAKQGKVEPARREEIKKVALNVGGGKVSRAGVDTLSAFLSVAVPKVQTAVHVEKPTEGGTKHPLELHIAKICGVEPASA